LLKLQLACPDYVLRTSKTFLEVTSQATPSSARRSKSAQPLGRSQEFEVREEPVFDVRYIIQQPDNVPDALVTKLCNTYLGENCNTGATLMWRGLPITWGIEELTQVLAQTKTRDVTYLYVPMNHVSNRKVSSTRNKRYAFIHFSTVKAAQRFAIDIRAVLLNGKAQMYASIAKHQGILANLAFLIAVPDKKKRQMLRSHLCAFLNPLRSDPNNLEMVSLLFSTLRSAMLANLQKSELCLKDHVKNDRRWSGSTADHLDDGPSTADETESWHEDE
jgi:hypothetical protein